MKYLK
jgi:hypothetical protein